MVKYKYVYECDDCEDIETFEQLMPSHFHCECGGHMFLRLSDNYEKIESYSKCDSCVHSAQRSACANCRRNALNKS